MENIRNYSVWIYNRYKTKSGTFPVFARSLKEVDEILGIISDLYNFYVIYEVLTSEEFTEETTQDILRCVDKEDSTLVEIEARDLSYMLIYKGFETGV